MIGEYVDISVAIRDKRLLYPLSASTVKNLCRDGILVATKLGDNRKGRGKWSVLRSSIIQHRINNHQQ